MERSRSVVRLCGDGEDGEEMFRMIIRDICVGNCGLHGGFADAG